MIGRATHWSLRLGWIAIGAVGAVLSAPAGARAQARPDQPSGGADAQPIEEIEVTGRSEDAAGTSGAASAGSIGRERIEDRPLLRPAEVLELVPGVIVTQHSGAGKANQYFLRGFNLDHGTDFLTTLDGVPLNLRSHAHGQGYTDLNFLIPELVQRVDYFKGPYDASKGDFASAGGADIHYAEALPESVLEVAGGSYRYGRALVAGSPALGGGKLLYGLELFHDDGPWERPDDYRRVNGVLRYTRQAGEAKWGLSAMGYWGTWNATDQVPLRALEAGQVGRYGTIDPTDGGRTYRLSLSADYLGGVAGGVLQANAYAVRYRLNLFSDFTYFLRDPVNGDQFEQADDRWQLGTSGRWTWTSSSGVPLRATAGWEVRHDRIEPVGLYDTVGRRRVSTVRQDFVRETSGALFVEGEASPARWLRGIAGIRYDHYLFDVISDNPANSGRDEAGRASPKVSAILGPWARTELFANYGLGFHSNDARGVTTTVDPASGAAVSKVTPLVRTRGAEVGLRTEIVPGVRSSLALWRLDIGSELLFTGDAGTTEPSRASRRQGIEWDARWQPMRWLAFDASVAWSEARFTSPDPNPAVTGDRVPGAIETAVSAGATIHELGRWTASLWLRYFGPRPLVEDDSVRASASTLVNGQASCRLTRWAALSLEVLNLLDARADDISYFYVSRLRGEPAAGVGDVHVHPADRRTVRVGAAFTF